MIHRFRVSNFRSVRESVELDFRIPRTAPDLPCFRPSRSRPDIRLPTVAALIGPNGSGKTSLLQAMATMIYFTVDQANRNRLVLFLPFESPESRASTTVIEAEFDMQLPFFEFGKADLLCRYQLILERDGTNLPPLGIGYEALHIFPKGRPKRVFERRRTGAVYVAPELGMRMGDDRLRAVPSDASAIAALAWMGAEAFQIIVKYLARISSNIAGPDPFRRDTDTATRIYQKFPELVNAVSEKLQRFDIGIDSMEVIELPDIGWQLLFRHSDLDATIPLISESSGTRHLTHTFPDLASALGTGHPIILDALDTDFHTNLTMELLNDFRFPETNPHQSQLICSLHNLSVLDDFEKEEVFIVEKSRDGATRAWGASDVAGLRRGTNLQKLYRSGALGGLPTIG